VALRTTVRASHGSHAERTVAYVIVRSDQGIGWGEVAALGDPVGTDPSLRQVIAALKDQWLPRLFDAARARGGQTPPSAVLSSLGGSRPSDRAAVAALEMALLDLELCSADMSLAEWLGVTQSSIAFGAVLGLTPDGLVANLRTRAQQLLDEGASRLRLKIEPGHAIEPASALVALEPTEGVQVDANGSFGPDGVLRSEAIEELRVLDRIGLACIEQPLAGADFTSQAALTSMLTTPLCLDESIISPRAARDAIRYEACRVLCVKPGRVGGVRAALGILEQAHAAGIGAFLGGMFETGLGRCALQALAAMPGASMISDAAAAGTYLLADPCEAPMPAGDRQPLWAGSGLGPHPMITAVQVVWKEEQ
jgi:O-succinylbenzoate synthase